MGIKKYKPTTPTRRWTSVSDFKEITESRPEKSLTKILKKSGGRNVYGRITVRGRGGGHKRKFRIIDFKRDKFDVPGKVVTVEYAPVKQWFTPGDLFALIADVRAEHPDLASAWLHPRLAWNARTITGTRGYKLWIFLKWIQRNA